MANAKVQSEKIFAGAGLWLIAEEGTVDDSYTPTATAGVFTLGSDSGEFPGDTDWKPLGMVSDAGSSVSLATETASKKSANSFYPVYTAVTGLPRSAKMTLLTNDIDVILWATNASSDTVSGTPDDTTGVATIVDPTPDQIVYRQLAWLSNDNKRAIIVYKALNKATSEQVFNSNENITETALEWDFLPPASTVSTSIMRTFIVGANNAVRSFSDV